MILHRLASYLRIHRRKSGLSQREIARALGCSEDAVWRHEQGEQVPSLRTALAYQVLYRAPIAELFPGMYDTVEQEVEKRLAETERTLQKKSAKDRDAKATARKLETLWVRRSGIQA